MSRVTETMGKSLLAMVLATTVLAVSGCAGPERGQSVVSATEAVSSITGLSGEVSYDGYYSGIEYKRWVRADVFVEHGYAVQDTRALLLWMARTAWSARDERPNRGMLFLVEFADEDAYRRWNTPENLAQVPHGMTVVATAQEAGNFFTTFGMNAQESDDPGFESWPGDVPTLPENVVVTVADG